MHYVLDLDHLSKTLGFYHELAQSDQVYVEDYLSREIFRERNSYDRCFLILSFCLCNQVY